MNSRRMIRLMNSPKLFSLLCLIILLIARINDAVYPFDCSPTTYAQNSTYQTNVNRLLSSLPSKANQSDDGFYNTTVVGQENNSNATVYGLFQCLGDADVQTCQKCVSDGIEDILLRCPNNTAAIGWYDKCWLRYSDQYIFSTMQEQPSRIVYISANATDPVSFMNRLGETLRVVAKEASEGGSKKFKTKTVDYSVFQTLYTMAQCTSDISEIDCLNCLRNGISNLPTCCYGNVAATTLKASCYLRYDTSAFYQEAPAPPAPSPESTSQTPESTFEDKTGISAGVIIAVVVPTVVFLLLVSLCFFLLKGRVRKYASIPEQTVDISSAESLQFDLDTIKSATNNFSPDNKLGQGGFGEVYKGILPGGQELAVKRLSSSSQQGACEFKNEVVTMAKLQHRNLVRLLGFCLDEGEKILIYEFLPNKSLDNFLFGLEKQAKLNWSKRYKIIEGIARGMLYLHEDSRLKIIHRDLKASNVLLDEDLNPKISDFGMAKIFGIDQTQTSTSKVVGTFGYIAPEYVMYDHNSVKSDIYSFGVLVLEIISGKKNTSFHASNCAENLPTYAWKLWREGKQLELLDPSLRDSCSRNEVINCIHISLLCIHENPALRPTLRHIMVMISSNSVTLPAPQQAAFLFDGGHRTDLDSKSSFENSSDQSTRKSMPQRSVDEDPITDIYPHKSRISAGIIVAIAFPTVVIFILLVALCSLCLRHRKGTSVPEKTGSLQFDLDTTKSATNDSSPDNKLGQGGYGEVYKGILPGGQEFAVKRLSNSSNQGVGEFRNEVVTMAKLQHRNLVRLLGFCLDEGKKIIIYEFLPTKVWAISCSALKLWREGKPLELLDSSLRDFYSRNEVIKCIHISLLCIQENPALRPIIQSIMVMLSSHSVTLSDPQEPPSFIGRHRTDSNNEASFENGSDQSTSKSSVGEDPITDLHPR